MNLNNNEGVLRNAEVYSVATQKFIVLHKLVYCENFLHTRVSHTGLIHIHTQSAHMRDLIKHFEEQYRWI